MPRISTLSKDENGGRGGIVFQPATFMWILGLMNFIWVVAFAILMVVRTADMNSIETKLQASKDLIVRSDARLMKLEDKGDTMLMEMGALKEMVRARDQRVRQ